MLLDVVLRWERGAQASASDGYRSSPPRSEPTLRDALADYLDGSGEPALRGQWVRAADGRHGRGAGPREESDDARARASVTRAVRDLLGDGAMRVRVRP